MKKPGVVLLILAPLFLAAPMRNVDAADARWKAIARPGSDERILYDPDSVVPSGPELFRVRIMDFDKGHASRRSLEEFDCRNRIYRDIEVFAETPNKPAQRTLAPSEWRGVLKESPRGELFKILCR